MSYIHTGTEAYPVTRATIEAALPTVIWADSNPPSPYALVQDALSPPTPGAGEVLVEGAPELVSGVWRKTWTAETDTSDYLISKELIVSRLTTMGKLDEVVGAITTEGMLIWSAANFVAPDDVHLLYLLDTAAGLTEGEITTITARP